LHGQDLVDGARTQRTLNNLPSKNKNKSVEMHLPLLSNIQLIWTQFWRGTCKGCLSLVCHYVAYQFWQMKKEMYGFTSLVSVILSSVKTWNWSHRGSRNWFSSSCVDKTARTLNDGYNILDGVTLELLENNEGEDHGHDPKLDGCKVQAGQHF
jgi:hypothetical protein